MEVYQRIHNKLLLLCGWLNWFLKTWTQLGLENHAGFLRSKQDWSTRVNASEAMSCGSPMRIGEKLDGGSYRFTNVTPLHNVFLMKKYSGGSSPVGDTPNLQTSRRSLGTHKLCLGGGSTPQFEKVGFSSRFFGPENHA